MLEEIKVCLQKQPERLQETRAIQKKIRQEKRSQLGAGLQALEQGAARRNTFENTTQPNNTHTQLLIKHIGLQWKWQGHPRWISLIQHQLLIRQQDKADLPIILEALYNLLLNWLGSGRLDLQIAAGLLRKDRRTSLIRRLNNLRNSDTVGIQSANDSLSASAPRD